MNNSTVKNILLYTALLMGGLTFALGTIVLYGWYKHNVDKHSN